jgi:hypothetical protein
MLSDGRGSDIVLGDSAFQCFNLNHLLSGHKNSVTPCNQPCGFIPIHSPCIYYSHQSKYRKKKCFSVTHLCISSEVRRLCPMESSSRAPILSQKTACFLPKGIQDTFQTPWSCRGWGKAGCRKDAAADREQESRSYTSLWQWATATCPRFQPFPAKVKQTANRRQNTPEARLTLPISVSRPRTWADGKEKSTHTLCSVSKAQEKMLTLQHRHGEQKHPDRQEDKTRKSPSSTTPVSQGGLGTRSGEYILVLICQLMHRKLDTTLISEDRLCHYL